MGMENWNGGMMEGLRRKAAEYARSPNASRLPRLVGLDTESKKDFELAFEKQAFGLDFGHMKSAGWQSLSVAVLQKATKITEQSNPSPRPSPLRKGRGRILGSFSPSVTKRVMAALFIGVAGQAGGGGGGGGGGGWGHGLWGAGGGERSPGR